MVDKDLIIHRLSHLDEYYRDLEEVRRDLSWEQFAADKVTRRYIERTLHMAIEACLDIANHIVSYEGYREPSSNKDTFRVLLEEGVLGDELAQRLQKMAQFRNVIVHDYIRVQPEIVYTILEKNISDIIEFAGLVKQKFL